MFLKLHTKPATTTGPAIKNEDYNQAERHRPVIPAIQEAEAEGLQLQGLLQHLSDTLSQSL